MFKLFYIISRYATSFWFSAVAKMMWCIFPYDVISIWCNFHMMYFPYDVFSIWCEHIFPQIDREGLSNVLNCFFLLLKPIKIKLLFFLWDFSSLNLVHMELDGALCAPSGCFQHVASKLQVWGSWKYFVLSGPPLANIVTLKPWNCYLSALLRLAS